MSVDDYDGQIIFGDLVRLKLPDIYLTSEENLPKISPRKLVSIGGRTRTRCVTGDLFSKVKEPLRGTRYNTRDELIRAIGWSIRKINKDRRADGDDAFQIFSKM